MNAVLDLIEQHAALDRAACALDDDNPQLSAIGQEMSRLENRIVLADVRQPAEVAAKRAFIQRTQFITDDRQCETGCLYELVAAILERDAERVGVRRMVV